MSIIVACQCGQRFMAEAHLAGQVVRCPVCGQGINVPASAARQVPPVQTTAAFGPVPQVAPGYAAGDRAQPHRPARPSGSKAPLYLGIIGGVLLLFFLGAIAAALIGYDLARTALKGAATGAAKAEPGKSAAPAAKSTQDNAAAPKSIFDMPSFPSFSGPPGKWRTHISESGKYSVSLPGEIISSDASGGATQRSGSPLGHVVSHGEDSSTASIVVIDLPQPLSPEIRDETLEKMLGGLIIYSPRTDGQYEKTTIAGHSGRGIRYSRTYGRDREKVNGRAQTFEVNGRVYQLLWVAPAELPDSAGDHFFGSFKLLPGAGSASLAQGPARAKASNIGPVVVFQMLDFKGAGFSDAAARSALVSAPWFNGRLVIDDEAKEIIAGVRGTSINTGPAKNSLEAVGFKIGTVTYKPGGR